MTEGDKPTRKVRVVVIGSSRPRLAKVMTCLLSMKNSEGAEQSNVIAVEYLPCVASFDVYEDENGHSIRYLASVSYHGAKGTEPIGASLAPFFDEEPPVEQQQQQQPSRYLGILGVAVGIGVEDSSDVEHLEKFFRTLRGSSNRPPLTLIVLQPNPEYGSMKEETEAFKKLSVQDKEDAARIHSMGPGKMALFVHDFASRLVQEILNQEAQIQAQSEHERTVQDEASMQQQQELKQQRHQELAALQEMDETKPRYACRKCRTLLFGEADLAEHTPAQQKFNTRKHYHGGVNASSCESYFVSENRRPSWTGDISDMEGRLSCPKCKSKVGTWHWAGAQCSCGTWVSPALQIPKSKVDLLNPSIWELSPGCPEEPSLVV